MRSDQPWYWLFAKYFGTMGSYRYATFPPSTLWACLADNGQKDTAPVLGALSYRACWALPCLPLYLRCLHCCITGASSPKPLTVPALGHGLRRQYSCLRPICTSGISIPCLRFCPPPFIVYGDRRIINVLAVLSLLPSYVNVAQVLYLHCEPNTANGLSYLPQTIRFSLRAVRLMCLYLSTSPCCFSPSA